MWNTLFPKDLSGTLLHCFCKIYLAVFFKKLKSYLIFKTSLLSAIHKNNIKLSVQDENVKHNETETIKRNKIIQKLLTLYDKYMIQNLAWHWEAEGIDKEENVNMTNEKVHTNCTSKHRILSA